MRKVLERKEIENGYWFNFSMFIYLLRGRIGNKSNNPTPFLLLLILRIRILMAKVLVHFQRYNN